MNADPQTPPEDGTVEEEARESDGGAALDGRGADGSRAVQLPAAADRLLPPFLLVQAWEPDAYDEVLLEWWGEGYLLECGSMHADARLAEHDHGRILALIVVEGGEDEDVPEEFGLEEVPA